MPALPFNAEMAPQVRCGESFTDNAMRSSAGGNTVEHVTGTRSFAFVAAAFVSRSHVTQGHQRVDARANR